MAIQMRRGNEVDFNAAKMNPGEWAVSLDTKYVRMCFSPGICLRMATYEAFEADMEMVRQILADCQTVQEAVERIQDEIGVTAVEVENYAQTAQTAATEATAAATRSEQSASSASQSAQTATEKATEATAAADLSTTNAQTSTEKASEAATSAQSASQSAIQASESAETATQKATEIVGQAERAEAAAAEAESYAKGGTGTRTGEDTDNALYYKEQARTEAEKAAESAKEAAAIAGIGIMTTEQAGIGKPDGSTLEVDAQGTLKVSDDFLPNSTVNFEQAEERSNISPMDSIKGIFGKISKWFSDLKNVAFTGSYEDLENKPAIPTKTSELTNDSGYVTTGNIILTFNRNGNADGTYTDAVSAELSQAGLSLDLSFQENMNLLKNIDMKNVTASLSIMLNANESVFNKSLPVKTGGILAIEYPKGDGRIFTFYDYRTGKSYINFDLNGTYGTWALMNPTPANNLTTTAVGTPLDAVQGKALSDRIGALSSLSTTVKTSIVAAINSLKDKLDFINVVGLQSPSYATLKEFVTATNNANNSNPKLFRFKDTGGWGPTGVATWYRCIVMYQNAYVPGATYPVGGDVLFLNGNNVLFLGYIAGTYNEDNLTITYKRVTTDNLFSDVKTTTCQLYAGTTEGSLGYGKNAVNYICVGNILFLEIDLKINNVITHPEGDARIRIPLPAGILTNKKLSTCSALNVAYTSGGYKEGFRRIATANVYKENDTSLFLALRVFRINGNPSPNLVAMNLTGETTDISDASNKAHLKNADGTVNCVISLSGSVMLYNA